MGCKYDKPEGCEAYPHRINCIGKVCESYVEEDYQGYIDELHRQIDSLYEIINAQANKIDKYEDALLNVALKLGVGAGR